MFMMKLFIVLASALVASGCTEHNSTEFNCTNLTQNYWETINNNKFGQQEDFLVLLDKLLQKEPACINALALRGQAFFSMGKYDRAKSDFFNLTKLDSNNVYAYFELGLISELERSFDSAVWFYEKAISKKMQGDLIVDKNNESQKIFGRRGFDVKYVSIKLRKGIANYYKGSINASFIDLNYCIKQDYSLDDAYLYRALIYSGLNKKRDACDDFKRAKDYGNMEVDADIQKHCN